MSWSDRAQEIRAIIFDVDGVLTDGRVGYGPDGIRIKFFDVRDGAAIGVALAAGLRVGFLSGRSDPATLERAKELALSFVYTDNRDKAAAFRRLLEDQSLEAAQCLYVGDDLLDVPVIRSAGIGIAVLDAAPEAREAADLVLERRGGDGAARAVIELLLRAQGRWDSALSAFLG
jgi:3-deoxy-D-manno-octulosonate 8-phosphate phosphatase (KDO 8-P phosphatase)